MILNLVSMNLSMKCTRALTTAFFNPAIIN